MTTYKLIGAENSYVTEVTPSVNDEPVPEGTVRVYPAGGGFAMLIPADRLEKVDEIPSDEISGWANIETDMAYPCLYDKNYKWNGWDCPTFSPEVFWRIIRDFDAVAMPVPDYDNPYCTRWAVIDEYSTDTPLDKLTEDELNSLLEEFGVVTQSKKDGRFSFDGYCWTCTDNLEEWDDVKPYIPQCSEELRLQIVALLRSGDITEISGPEILRCLKGAPDANKLIKAAGLLHKAGDLTINQIYGV
jgi:hypothetical protein